MCTGVEPAFTNSKPIHSIRSPLKFSIKKIHWINKTNFYSKLAVFDGKKAIRGGIPFVFPQFGAWSYGPQHGFARIMRWTCEHAPERLPSGDIEAVFSCMDNDFTRSMWNYQ